VFSQPPLNRIHWRRTLLVLALLCVATFMGLLMMALVIE